MRLRIVAVPLVLGSFLGALASANPSFDVIAPLEGQSSSAALAVSADGCRVVGQSDDEALSWRDGVSSPIREYGWYPVAAQAVSPDGQSVGGTTGSSAFVLTPGWGLQSLPGSGGFSPTDLYQFGSDWTFAVGRADEGHGTESHPYFRSPSGTWILPGGRGEARALSADHHIAGGWSEGQAALWDLESDSPPQLLGALTGDTWSEVRGLSANGAVAVGSSRAAYLTTPRAFRWTAKGMLELGAGTRVANGVTADGNRVVGEADLPGVGPTAFVWDPVRGVRPLAQALRDEYSLDVGEFQLLSATAVTPDGKTFVGTGIDAEDTPRGWRARLHDERCSFEPVASDLLAGHAGNPPLDVAFGLATDSQQRVYVSGSETGNLLRVDPAAPGDAPEELIDAGGAAVLHIAADDSLYVVVDQQLRRIEPAGATQVLFDGAAWPPLPPFSLETRPVDLAMAPDGTLFVAAQARVVRIDLDGSVHELLAPAVHESLNFVALGSEGRVFAATSSGFHVLAPGSAPDYVPLYESLDWIYAFRRDPSGGFWSFGSAIAQVHPDGGLHVHFAPDQIPDGIGGTLENALVGTVDQRGNAYYAADAVMRLTPTGEVKRLLDFGTPLLGGDIVGNFIARSLHVADDVLYVADDNPDGYYGPCPPYYEWYCWVGNAYPPRILRVALPGKTVCENGLDDDGDGLADFPDDPGCLSAEDEGERSFDRPCDNGIDDDQDGSADYPADPACTSLDAPQEKTECDDGVDNDGDGAVDWDGAGTGVPDAECVGNPAAVIEHPWYCGLGFEVALVVLPLTQAARRWRRRSEERSECATS